MSDNLIHAYAAMRAGADLEPYQFDAGELKPHQVEVQVENQKIKILQKFTKCHFLDPGTPPPPCVH